jgi:2,5-diamino-6-(ribosylamino)-4(3H)-pyrimidinone 5'-phosphate reductase
MKPYVVMYNAISLDGRINGFDVDMDLYYGQISRWSENATLVGCDTLLQGLGEVPAETEADLACDAVDPEDQRPLLVVPDSRGRFRHWHFLRQQPYWRDFLVLCTRKTPPDYLDYLDQRSIHRCIVGDDRVDYVAALAMLNEKFGVSVVRMDSGGTLNGILLRAGLVDEVNLLVHPVLVGGTSTKSFFEDRAHGDLESYLSLSLKGVEQVKNGLLLLTYDVVGSKRSD